MSGTGPSSNTRKRRSTGRSSCRGESYNHPELGQGEIGGWVSTYVGGNALPGPSLEHVADVHWQFELFKAGLLPKLEITEATAETLSSRVGPGS